MKTAQDYRHPEAWEGLCDSKELQTNILLVSHVQTLRKNDTEQNSTTKNSTNLRNRPVSDLVSHAQAKLLNLTSILTTRKA